MENKRQHYVPQVYLRNFSCEDKFINTFDKETGKMYTAAIDKVCCLDDLYTIWEIDSSGHHITKSRNLSLEKDFFASNIEKKMEDTLKYFLDITRWWWQTKSTGRVISSECKQNIAEVVTSQILRMPDTIEANSNMVQSICKQISNIISSTTASNANSLLNEVRLIQLENKINPALSQVNNTFFNGDFFASFVNCLYNNYWTLTISPYAEFYTCDRPVNLCRHCDDVRPMFLGFGEEGAEVSYTINPCLSLSIWDKQHFPDKENEDCTFRLATRREIAHINVLRYFTAKRHVFSVGKDFVYANKMYLGKK